MNLFRSVAVLAVVLGSVSAEENWPQFRGANHGIAASAKAPTALNVEKPRWRVETPPGYSSPCIWGDSIFLSGGNRETKELELICFNRSNGSVKWRSATKATDIEKSHDINGPATPTPVTDGKRVITYFPSIGLIAHDFDGKELWRAALPMPQVFLGFGTGSSPLLADGRVFVPVGVGDQSFIAAFDAADGREVWRRARPLYNKTWASPIAWREAGKTRIGMVSAGRFVAYDWADGADVWHIDGIANQVCATPTEKNGTIYITSAGVFAEREAMTVPGSFEKMKQYDANGDGLLQLAEIPESVGFVDRGTSDNAGNMSLRGFLGRMMGKKSDESFNPEQWEATRNELIAFEQSSLHKTSVLAVKAGGEGDVTASNVLWTESRGVPEIPSPLLIDDRVYMIKNGGVLVCREAGSGKLLFEERIGASGGYYASPIAAGENICVVSDKGEVTIVPAGEKAEVLGRANLGERVQATPAIVDSTLYIRTQNRLWAFAND